MQKRATVIIIRAIAIITAATALYILSRSWGYYWFLFVGLFQGRCPLDHLSFFGLILTLTLGLKLVFKLLSSYGLFQFKSWARNLAIVVLLFDYALGLVHAIRMCWYTVYPPELPPIEEGVIRRTISLWPTYIIALLGIISVFFLTRGWIISQFKETAVESG